ncbi:MAG: hypothetical protein WCK51_08740 [Armatimonadota bacterium]
MKPEVEAAIESRRQWFWVWVVGVCGGFGVAIFFQMLGQNLLGNWVLLIAALFGSGLILFVQTLRLQKALMAWIVFIGAICAIITSLFFAFVEAMMG